MSGDRKFPETYSRYPENEGIVEKRLGGVDMPLSPKRGVPSIGEVRPPTKHGKE